MQGTKVIVIDPEREYKQLTSSVAGTYIKFSVKSKEKINPFDFALSSYSDEGNLPEHIQDLTELISLMVEGLTPEEQAVVDKAIILTYKSFGFTLTGKKKKNSANKKVGQKDVQQYPLLKDLYKTLKQMKGKKLSTRLEKYVTIVTGKQIGRAHV